MKKSLGTAGKIVLAIIGVALIAAGIICLVSPLSAGSAVFKVIGIVLIATGATTAVFFFLSGSFLIFSWMLLVNAAVDIFSGILFCSYSETAAAVFAVIFGLLLVAVGLFLIPVTFIVKKVSDRSGGKIWIVTLIAAAAFLVIGIVSCMKPSTFGISVVAIPIGLALIIIGALYLFIDYSLIKKGSESKYFKDVD